MGPMPLYNSFFYPTAMEIVTTISLTIQVHQTLLILKCVAFIITDLIVTIVMIVISLIESHYIHFALWLLRHCPAIVMTKSNAIMNLLSGHTSSKGEETTEHTDVFFNAVMKSITDIVTFVNTTDNMITTVNDAFCNYFGIQDGRRTANIS